MENERNQKKYWSAVNDGILDEISSWIFMMISVCELNW